VKKNPGLFILGNIKRLQVAVFFDYPR